MTKALYFDPFSGISGDMTLGALLHAGMPLQYLETELAKLALPNFHLEMKTVTQHAISGMKLEVIVENPELEEHRNLNTIRGIINRSGLAARVKERANRIFSLLAEAEGQVHGIPAEQVHFHEVGAVDSIVDIVGACIGFEFFGIEEFYCGMLPLGSGFIKVAHGLMPVPAPATLQLLTGAGAVAAPQVTLGDGSEYPPRAELVTPTGAAIVAALCKFQRPAMRLEKTGYGYGSKEFAWPNALRVWIGETQNTPSKTHSHAAYEYPEQHREHRHEHHHPHDHHHDSAPAMPEPAGNFERDEVSVLETNLDDMSAEGLGFLMEKLMSAEALDVYFTPVQMKKNRPGVLLGVIARPQDEARLAGIILRETSAFGLRVTRSPRYKVERAFRQVEIPEGNARVKLKIVEGKIVEAVPEYESVAGLARQTGRPFRELYEEVRQAANTAFAGLPVE